MGPRPKCLFGGEGDVYEKQADEEMPEVQGILGL